VTEEQFIEWAKNRPQPPDWFVERESYRKFLRSAIKTRLLTAEETQHVIDMGTDLFVDMHWTGNGASGAAPCTTMEMERMLLDLWYQQARFRALESAK